MTCKSAYRTDFYRVLDVVQDIIRDRQPACPNCGGQLDITKVSDQEITARCTNSVCDFVLEWRPAPKPVTDVRGGTETRSEPAAAVLTA